MFFDRKRSSQPDLANLKITDARVGDTISVAGAAGVAEDLSDIDFTVDRRDRYEAGSRVWTMLSGTWRDRRVFLEVYDDDAVDILGNFDGRKLTLDQLALSEQDLSEIDQRQNPADFFDFEEKFWMFGFSREMTATSPDRTGGRGFYGWQFHEQGGNRYISVRKFAGQPFAAAIWTRIPASDITVFRGA